MFLRHPPPCVGRPLWFRRHFVFAGLHGAPIRRKPILITSLNASTSSNAGRKLSDDEVASWAADNPDLDEIVLDDAYYEDIGMTREQAMRQQQELMYSVDPEAMPLDEMASVNEDLPEEWRKAIENLEVYGPQALLMAGFRAEEYAVARATLDSLGADQVKVLPVSQEMLQLPLELAVQQQEIDWTSPRPPQWILGGGWGSQRTLMFSGLSIKVQATLIELLEAQGLPPVCVTMALQEDAQKKLGDLLAAAVKAQRKVKPPPSTPPWEVSRKANPPPSSSTAGSGPTASAPARPPPVAAAAAAASTADVKKAIAASLPGRKGPLFSRSSKTWSAGGPAATAAAAEGLEPLEQLIPPNIARQRLQADATADPAGIADLLDLDIPYGDDDSSSSPGSTASGGNGAVGGSSSSSRQQGVQVAEDPSQALVDWFTNDADGSLAMELPWEEDEGAQSSRKAAAAGTGFPQVERWEQQQQQPQQHQPAAAAAAGAGSSGGGVSAVGESPDLLLDDLLPPLSVGDITAATPGNTGSGGSSKGPVGLPEHRRPAAAAGGSDTTAAAASFGGGESNGSGNSSSMLAAIQAALKSGVNPEQLKQLIDSAAAAAAAASDPIDLMMREDAAAESATASSKKRPAAAAAAAQPQPMKPAAAASPANSAASSPLQQQQQQPSKPPTAFGPAPPPAAPRDDGEPLLKLRPEIERAFQNNQVKFVDINKFPKKYKQQYTLAAMQERQRQQQQMQLRPLQQLKPTAGSGDLPDLSAAQPMPIPAAADASPLPAKQQQQQRTRGRWWQQRQQYSQNVAAKALSELPAGGKLVEIDVADGSLSEMTSDTVLTAAADEQAAAMQQQQQQFDGSFEDGLIATEDSYYSDFGEAEVDEDEEAAEPPVELDEAKLRLLVQSAEQEGLDVARTMAEALAFGVIIQPEVAAAAGVPLPTAGQVAAAKEEIVDSIRHMQEHQQEGGATTSGEGHADEAALTGQQQNQLVGVRGRAWGSGLSDAVSRARARLAEKQRLQQ